MYIYISNSKFIAIHLLIKSLLFWTMPIPVLIVGLAVAGGGGDAEPRRQNHPPREEEGHHAEGAQVQAQGIQMIIDIGEFKDII